MLAAAHSTPVNLNVVSHKDVVIMSFSHYLVIVAICLVLEAVAIRIFWSVACRGGLINFSESKSIVNIPFSLNHICMIHTWSLGPKVIHKQLCVPV